MVLKSGTMRYSTCWSNYNACRILIGEPKGSTMRGLEEILKMDHELM